MGGSLGGLGLLAASQELVSEHTDGDHSEDGLNRTNKTTARENSGPNHQNPKNYSVNSRDKVRQHNRNTLVYQEGIVKYNTRRAKSGKKEVCKSQERLDIRCSSWVETRAWFELRQIHAIKSQ